MKIEIKYHKGKFETFQLIIDCKIFNLTIDEMLDLIDNTDKGMLEYIDALREQIDAMKDQKK